MPQKFGGEAMERGGGGRGEERRLGSLKRKRKEKKKKRERKKKKGSREEGGGGREPKTSREGQILPHILGIMDTCNSSSVSKSGLVGGRRKEGGGERIRFGCGLWW